MRRIALQHYRHLLGALFLIFLFVGMASAQANAPAWAVGDWWVVECQVYDLGKVGPTKPGWGPRQAWHFQVEKIADLAGQPHFVVSIKPIKENACPYSFRYWFRVSDRHVGRQELLHPNPTIERPRVIGPPVVITDFPAAAAGPFFTYEFPTLPLTVPLFTKGIQSRSFPANEAGFEISQQSEEVASAAVKEKADSSLTVKIDKGNRLIKLDAGTNIIESQYWSTGLPWCAYGERFDKTYMSRRYWLVEMGKR